MYDDMCWDRKCGIWRDCALAVSRLVHCATQVCWDVQGDVQGVRWDVHCARWCMLRCARWRSATGDMIQTCLGSAAASADTCWGLYHQRWSLWVLGDVLQGTKQESLWCRTLQGTLTERYTLWGLDYDIYVRTSLISHVLLKKQIFCDKVSIWELIKR